MNPRRLLAGIVQGNVQNVAFRDARRLAEAQDVRGEAKPYQLRHLLRLVERYGLILEDGT